MNKQKGEIVVYNSMEDIILELFPLLRVTYWKSATKADMQAMAGKYLRAFSNTRFTFNQISEAMYRFMDMNGPTDEEGKKVSFPEPRHIKEILTGEKIEYTRNRGVYDIIPQGRMLIEIWDDHPDKSVIDHYTKGRLLSEAYKSHSGMTQFEAWAAIFRYFSLNDQAWINRERKRIADYDEREYGILCCQPFKIFVSLEYISTQRQEEIKKVLKLDTLLDDTLRQEGTQYSLSPVQKSIVKEWWKNYDEIMDKLYRKTSINMDSGPVSNTRSLVKKVSEQLNLEF